MKILIVEARFYEHISDMLLQGAVAELTKAGAGFKRVQVPGILEIPAAIAYAVKAMELRAIDERYTGFLTLGCALQGETQHYDHVCREAMRGVQDLALDHCLAVGNGILTCPNEATALERADPSRRNFGGQAARATLRMIELKHELRL